MGPSRLRPGWISASGFAVSTVVATIATNQPLLATWNRVSCFHFVSKSRELQLCKAHLCCVGNHGDVDVRISSDLLLWDDDLGESWNQISGENEARTVTMSVF